MEECEKAIKGLMKTVESEELYGELDDVLYEITEFYEDLKGRGILSIDRFKRQLEQQNLMTKELEEFIENYMRFDNVC